MQPPASGPDRDPQALVIEIGVSTMNAASAEALRLRLLPGDAAGAFDGRVLVINQCPDTSAPLPPDVTDGPLRMFSFRERGVARSRNRVLALSRGDIVAFADDDIEYLPGFAHALQTAFAAFPAAAAITFPVLAAETGQPTRRFPTRPRRHTSLSVTGVGTIEIAVRPGRLSGVRFDERFGLGAPVPQGDEPIFLTDAMRAGLEVRHWPVPLCQYAGLSSGRRPWSPDMVRAKRAVLRRMYPHTWPALAGAMWLSKYPSHGRALGVRRWTQAWLRSLRERPGTRSAPR